MSANLFSDDQYHTAMHLFMTDVMQEAFGAKKKFPGTKHIMLAFNEEVGELNKAIMEHDRGEVGPEEVWAEAVQSAAMAMRVALEGDPSCAYRYSAELSAAFTPLGGRPAEPYDRDKNWIAQLRADGLIPALLHPKAAWAGCESEAL